MGLRIQQLSALVANQIAAGEVVERPASVVKELLENALDSGATSIAIDIGFGGLNQIKISDNGSGIIAEDLPLAIAAHATSKISQLDDLYAITSMGFRGEALASIAAMSRLAIISKPAEQDHGMMLRVAGGTTPSITPCARSQGTTVEVMDLFFNAPVRKKFLKSPRTEYLAIELVVKRFALSAPAIALSLRHNDKLILNLPAARCEKTLQLRIKKLLGKLFLENAIQVHAEHAGMTLSGWVSGREYQRSQNDKQWIYINQRMVKDKLLQHAFKQAYETILHPGCYPACLLYFTIPPQEMDVNVHPTKHEVRFQQPRLVHDLIVSQITKALSLSDKIPEGKQRVEDIIPTNIREEYMPLPLTALKFKEEPLAGSWSVLNARFAIVHLQTKHYLVDVERIQQQRIKTLLQQEAFPLASRPLLVPIRLSLVKQDVEQYQPHLENLGITLEWVNEGGIVRSIPQLFPQLDIKQLFSRLQTDAPVDWIALFVSCLAFDVRQLIDEEKMVLVDFLYHQLHTSKTRIAGCLHLDAQACQELLYATE